MTRARDKVVDKVAQRTTLEQFTVHFFSKNFKLQMSSVIQYRMPSRIWGGHFEATRYRQNPVHSR